MSDQLEPRETREALLEALYDGSAGGGQVLRLRQVAERAGIPKDRAVSAARVLAAMGLVGFPNSLLPSLVNLTRAGVEEVERLRDERGPGQRSERRFLDVEVHQKLEVVLRLVEAEFQESPPPDEGAEADVRADIDCLVAQVRAQSPNRGVVRAAIDRMKRMWPHLESAVTTAAAIATLLHGL